MKKVTVVVALLICIYGVVGWGAVKAEGDITQCLNVISDTIGGPISDTIRVLDQSLYVAVLETHRLIQVQVIMLGFIGALLVVLFWRSRG